MCFAISPPVRRPRPKLSCLQCTSRCASILAHLDTDLLTYVDSAKGCNFYSAKQTLHHEGEIAHGVFVIHSGRVKLLKTDINGNSYIVRIAGQGDLFGYHSMLNQTPYCLSAITLEDSVICFLDGAIFLKLIGSSTKTALNLMKLMATNMQTLENQLISMARKSIRERFIELLAQLSTQHGQPCADGTIITIHLTRDEMADLIGTSHESVTRLLSDCKQEGLIRVEGRRITVINLAALSQHLDTDF